MKNFYNAAPPPSNANETAQNSHKRAAMHRFFQRLDHESKKIHQRFRDVGGDGKTVQPREIQTNVGNRKMLESLPHLQLPLPGPTHSGRVSPATRDLQKGAP
ncbi:MAG: hypothetical protein IPL79_15690 [Myxococcales bacterium]|nr:hypothetical protein [Myxococcales bacterium]